MKLYAEPLTPVDEEYVRKARSFAEERMAPIVEDVEQQRRQPALLREMIAEFTKLYIPKTLGGLGASTMTICRELEELARVDYGVTFAFEVHNHAAMVLSMTENKALRNRYLPGMLTGDTIGAFLLTEPGAGSDAASIRCRAQMQDGHYVINGEKAWVTNAGTADLLLVFAQTGEAPKDVVALAVERTAPGVEFQGAYHMAGAHAAETGAFVFNNVSVPADHVIFPTGDAFYKALGAIEFARFAIAAMANGAFLGALETAIAYDKERVQFGRPLLKNQGLQWKLADQVTRLEASRMLTYLAAKTIDDCTGAAGIAAHCKKYAVECAFRGVNTAIQCMGSNGLKREYPLVRQMTALTTAFNADGTNDICNVVISKSL